MKFTKHQSMLMVLRDKRGTRDDILLFSVFVSKKDHQLFISQVICFIRESNVLHVVSYNNNNVSSSLKKFQFRKTQVLLFFSKIV